MTGSRTVWGVHMGGHVGDRPIEGGYVAIGWPELGDLSARRTDRDALKVAVAENYPEEKAGAIPVHAGTMFKFMNEIRAGDYVVYPSKSDRMVNIGLFKGGYEYVEGDRDDYPNRQKVEWKAHLPRSDFSQSALHEIGSAVTLFRVKHHAAEYLSKAGVVVEVAPTAAFDPEDETDETADDDMATFSVSRQAEETTSDFVIRKILAELSGHDFEHLVAHVLECLGYTARVTQKSADGGVDVIAHMDALGFQPPIVKVQCKRTTAQTGRPDVDQLLGTLGDGEYGLFVTLGSYSRSAIELERNRVKLRLIDGDEFVEILLENYQKLSPRYRSLIPLKQIYVPDIAG
ncbi:MAG: restriction endonuclease [Pseudomonadota bacterium]